VSHPVTRLAGRRSDVKYEGYKPGAAKSADEYANLDAEDESLARWKASLGIVPGATGGDTSGPKVCGYAILSVWLLTPER